jgi:DNA-directed RNA polymerase specialized sigma24 family protein
MFKRPQKSSSALSYLENEFDRALQLLRIEKPRMYHVIDCHLTGYTHEEGAKFLGITYKSYLIDLKTGRKILREFFANDGFKLDNLLDGRALNNELVHKMAFLFPKHKLF